jgi:protein-L-isoaspartate O-methyltransferase
VGITSGSDRSGDPAEVAAFTALLDRPGQRLLDAVGAYDEAAALAVVERLRREGLDPALVATAMTQARLRARARTKFGSLADRLFFTEEGLEQATRPAVAARHAQRYVDAGRAHVADLCCGIGTELSALASAGITAIGIDRDPLACAVARANLEALGVAARAAVTCADVTSPELDLDPFDGLFIDPARRTTRGRTFDPKAYSPPYDVVLDLARQVAATGAKLAPGIPHDVLPPETEAEWVSDSGSVLECALWFGPLATGVARRATLLPSCATLTGDGKTRAEVGSVQRFLYEPDGAVIRAGLVAEAAELVSGSLVDPTIAYITAEDLVSTPFCTAYEVLDVLPFQLKRLRAFLQSRSIGRLTIKKRGSAIEPEALRRQLRLHGDTEATIVLTRLRGAAFVLVVEPFRANPPHLLDAASAI